jgi:ABC-2 type transport system ATP-binding protein
MQVISTDAVFKNFGRTAAIRDISLTVNQGEIYGFLGLNGAGKTTLIRMLLGMVKPDTGRIYLFEKRLATDFPYWNEVGYLVEAPYSYPDLSVTENLLVYYKLRRLRNPQLVTDVIERLKLGEYKHTRTKALSLGNQQRLGLAKALMHRPKLIILDEPINGLDPEGIIEIRELLKELISAGSAIFLSSHILAEISRLAHRIAIIHEGKLIKEITVDELSAALHKRLLIDTTDNRKALEYLKNAGIPAALNREEEIEVSNETPVSSPEIISKMLIENGFSLRKLYLHTEDLEKYFIRTIRN